VTSLLASYTELHTTQKELPAQSITSKVWVLKYCVQQQGHGERYNGMSSCTGPPPPKNEEKKTDLKDTTKKRIKNIKIYKGVMLWAADVCSWATLAQPGPFLRSCWAGFSQLG